MAQYAPPAGQPGSTAVSKDSSLVKAWATSCTLIRGYRQVNVPDSGYASVGDNLSVIGKAGENGVASLGDGGSATVQFSGTIANKPGPDFAIFENSFDDRFLELAYVEVSSDGSRFVRFPAISLTQDTVQIASFDYLDAKNINNLAGKYRAGFGTPFDLAELADSSGLDIQHISHIRIIDVIGTIAPAYARYDSKGKKINDPWPTNFPSSGFDLDAVAVLNASIVSDIEERLIERLSIYPNPAKDQVYISGNTGHLQILDVSGRTVLEQEVLADMSINCSDLPAGYYILRLSNSNTCFTTKLIKE